VKRLERVGLSLLGAVLFLSAWQGIVLATRPAPVLRATLGFSTPVNGEVVAEVLDVKGHRVAKEKLAIDEASREATVGKLRLWLGSVQPTLAAVPPANPDTRPLLEAIQAAKTANGAGLEVREVALSEKNPDGEAFARASRLQLASGVRPSWLPNPWDAGIALWEMVLSGELIRHIVASLFRVFTGFVLATVLGVPFGLALGLFARLYATANGVIQALRPISPIAWLPVATLALGGGDLAAIFLIFLSAFFPIAVSAAAAVGTVDTKYRRSAMNFGVEGLDAARRVIFPASLPAILTSIRIAVGIAWVVVVAAEMLGVESGLGYLVLDARNQLRYDRVVAAMLVIGTIGLLLDGAVRYVEKEELARRGLART
jgi:NitT/TauT family transport system permease protein